MKKKDIKFNKDYVFMSQSGAFHVFRFVKKNGKTRDTQGIFVRSLKKDSYESMNKRIKARLMQVPIVGHFEWPYRVFGKMLETSWECLGFL
jgi:pullulanase/glycogen debranching enzyme